MHDDVTGWTEWLVSSQHLGGSVLGSKNVFGVQWVAPGYTHNFYKDMNVSFHVAVR